MVPVCLSSPGVCVRRWFGVPCLLDWWTYQRHCASARAKPNTAESCLRRDPLSVGTTGAEPDGLFGGRACKKVLRNVMASSPQFFDMPETDFSFCSDCKGCYHCLQPSGCSRHLGDGVPPRHGNEFYDGCVSIPSPVFQQVPDRPFLTLRQ